MSFNRLFGIAVCVIVAIGVILAFLAIGTPGHARLVALDGQRTQDLEEIASRLHDRYGENGGTLPKALPGDLTQRDPANKRAYEYLRRGRRNYQLCAIFALRAERNEKTGLAPWFPVHWPHGSGRTCYGFDVSTYPIDPHPIAR